MPRFIIDNCISIEAPSLDAANKDAEYLRELVMEAAQIRRKKTDDTALSRVTAVNICHVEQIPEEPEFPEPLFAVALAEVASAAV